MPATEEQMIALMKSKGITDEQINQGRAIKMGKGYLPQQQKPQSVNDMIRGINPVLGDAVGKMAGAVSQMGGATPATDYSKIFAEQAIKSQFENDPNSLDYQSKMSTINLNKEKEKLARAGYTQDEQGNIVKAGKPGLTPGQQTQQDNSVKEIYQTREMNEAKRRMIDNALTGSENIPQGWWGKTKLGVSKSFPGLKPMLGVNDSMIQDSQEMKMALTMGTLAETAHTKGAISDSEMMLFKEASANDDFNNPAVIPVLKKIKDFTMAEESGLYGAYKQNYGEDPRGWFGEGQTGNPLTTGKKDSLGIR